MIDRPACCPHEENEHETIEYRGDKSRACLHEGCLCRAFRSAVRLPDNHPAKVMLREAAVAWVEASRIPASDAKDAAFTFVDNRLMRTALNYAAAVSEAVK